MNDRIYLKQIKLWKALDTVYYFFYNMEEEELIDYDDKSKAQIMVEYNCRTKIVSFYIEELLDINNRNKADIICECQGSTEETTFYFTQIKEPCGQRFAVISAPLKHFLDDNVKLPPNIKEVLFQIRKYIEGE